MNPSPFPVAMGAPVPQLSIVSTMYRSLEFLPRFIDECTAAALRAGFVEFELVLVNDGSPDESLAYAVQRQATDRRIVVVDLSRNFGHHNAVHAGLRHARAELVFLIDCDLEVRPAVLTALLSKLKEARVDLVYGYQEARKGGWFERISGSFFYKGINALSDVRIPENVLTERLMTRRYLDALLQLGDFNLFMAGMMSWVGFAQIGIPLAKAQRQGKSSYTLGRRIQLMVNAVSSFSSKPLTWLFNMGVMITLLSFAYVAYLIFRKLAFGDALLGFTSMMALISITLGITTTALGLVGIYLGKVFNQVQNRPTYIVRDVYR